MNARSILILSLGLNLVLAGWFAARLRNRGAAPLPAVPEGTVSEHPLARLRIQRTNVLEVTTNVVVGPGFRWAQLETNDFRAYVANLRAVGCPERTVQHLLIAEIEETYSERIENEPPHPFWETASQRANRKQALELRRIELKREQRALLRELVGINYSSEAFEAWRKEADVASLLGYLDDGKALQVMDTIEEAEGRGKAIRSQARGILIDEDEAKIQALVAETQQALASNLAPFEAEELNLRLMALIQGESFGRQGFIGTDLTGNEVRTLSQLAAGGKDPMEILIKMMVSESELPDVRKDPPEDFEVEARKLLGDQRYAAYLRSGDEKFRDAHNIAMEQKLPPAAAETVYEVHRAAEDEFKRLGADDSLSAEQRRATLNEVRTTTEQTIRQTLGEEGAKKYLERRRLRVPGEGRDR